MSNWWATDLPNWLVAVGTVGAFGTGGAVLLRELSRDREREAVAQRQQASNIAAWPIREGAVVESFDTLKTRLVINNASSEPVYRVQVEYFAKNSEKVFKDEIEILPPGRYEREVPTSLQEIWIGTEEGWVERSMPGTAPISDPNIRSWNFALEISFVDSNGCRWRRHRDGSLKTAMN